MRSQFVEKPLSRTGSHLRESGLSTSQSSEATLMIPARPTTYKGIPMRSRLEATAAAELDHFGWQWVYEPRAYASEAGQYLPDFELLAPADGVLFPRRTFMEVRPTVERAYLAMPLMLIIRASIPDAYLLIHVPDEISFINRTAGSSWQVVVE